MMLATTRGKILILALAISLFALDIRVGFAQTVSFNPATNFLVGTGPAFVAIGDFNKDGKLDLAVARAPDGNVSILLGVGNGTFGAATNFARGSRSGVGGGGGFQRGWEAGFGGGES